MSQRLFNFSAGPATMPLPVLQASASALVDYQASGVGIAEVSHRGKEFIAVLAEAKERCRALMGIPDDYEILFLQGGATQQFELVPMNLLKTKAAYSVTGSWAKKAAAAAKRYGEVVVAGDSSASNFAELPPLEVPADAEYLHICSNNTIYGTRYSEFPEHDCLVADMSSEIASRVIDVSRFGLIYAGAQKNLGPAGLTLVIIRRDLLDADRDIPAIFNYAKHAEADSCLNTPPTFGIYVLLETFRWIEEQGGVAALEERNARKAGLLYSAIDGSDGFYTGAVTDIANRSEMNVTFTLPDDELSARFISEAAAQGMVALKGHRSVGGIRASVYNAMPEAGCARLAEFMETFRKQA